MRLGGVKTGIISAAIITGLLYLVSSHHYSDRKLSDGVIVVTGSGEPNRRAGWEGAGSGAALRATDVDANHMTLEDDHGGLDGNKIVNQLHELIDRESKDIIWEKSVRQDVESIVSGVPFLTSHRSLTCGTIRCELSIETQSGISDQNFGYVMSRLYTLPAFDHEPQFVVEGAFPVVRAGQSSREIRVIYMRQ